MPSPPMQEVWRAFFAPEEPETELSHKRLELTESSATIDRWRCRVRSRRDRTDVIKEADVPPPPVWFGDFKSLASGVSVVKDFADRSSAYLAMLAEGLHVWRIALAGRMNLAVTSKEDAYAVLDGLLPFGVTSEMSDLLYQINRPRRSSTGVKINRLAKWAAERRADIELLIGAGVVREAGAKYSVRLEFDINTDAERDGSLEVSWLPTLLSEMKDSAVDIMMNGDIP